MQAHDEDARLPFELIPDTAEQPGMPPLDRLMTFGEVGALLGLERNSVRRRMARLRCRRWKVRRDGQTLLAVDVRDVRRVYAHRIAAPAGSDPDSRDIRPLAPDDRPDDRPDTAPDSPSGGASAGRTGPDIRPDGSDSTPDRRDALVAHLERGLERKEQQLARLTLQLGEAVGERAQLAAQLQAAASGQRQTPMGEGGAGRAVRLSAALGLAGALAAAIVVHTQHGATQERARALSLIGQAADLRAADLEALAASLAAQARAVGERERDAELARALAARRLAGVREELRQTLSQGLGPGDVLREVVRAHVRLAAGR